jgi:hypothetical protein
MDANRLLLYRVGFVRFFVHIVSLIFASASHNLSCICHFDQTLQGKEKLIQKNMEMSKKVFDCKCSYNSQHIFYHSFKQCPKGFGHN